MYRNCEKCDFSTRRRKHINCKHSNMEKINVTNVKISFSDREDVKNHDLYALKTPNAAILLKLLQGKECIWGGYRLQLLFLRLLIKIITKPLSWVSAISKVTKMTETCLYSFLSKCKECLLFRIRVFYIFPVTKGNFHVSY